MTEPRLGHWGPYTPWSAPVPVAPADPYLAPMAHGYRLSMRADALVAKIFEVSAPMPPPPPGIDDWRRPGTRRQPPVPRGQGRCKVFATN